MGITVDGKHYRVQFKGNVITLMSEKRLNFLFLFVPARYFSTSLKKNYLASFLPKRDIGILALYNVNTKISLQAFNINFLVGLLA